MRSDHWDGRGRWVSWGPLCGVSSGRDKLVGWLGVVEGVVSEHRVEGEDASVGEGEDGLVVAFALGDFALVVGAADRVRAWGGKGGVEHDSLEALVADVRDMLTSDLA